MKLLTILVLIAGMLFSTNIIAQNRDLQYFRPNDRRGVNVFETPKTDTIKFDKIRVRVGGDFALQFQGLSHENGNPTDTLVDLGSNFNLPTANLNLDVQLQDGLRMHLRTYLSSRHHAEAYVKGGYIQIDKLDWISEGLLANFMSFTTVKIGMDQINYGDAQFRRSDNAMAIYNPFVGNYIMDAFTTEPFVEVTFQPANFIIVGGFTNGRLNQNPKKGDDGFVFYGKLGYDNQINDNLRVRLTGSLYTSNDKGTRDYIYGGDRAGGRYYATLESINSGGSDFDPRFNPRWSYLTSFQINPFIQFYGLEFFGVYENSSNGNDNLGGEFTQLAADLLYRFGGQDQFYLGFRYNDISGESSDDGEPMDINRFNVGGGWYLTRNVMAKIEYVKQKYDGDGWNGSRYQEGQFNGVVFEAVIGF